MTTSPNQIANLDLNDNFALERSLGGGKKSPQEVKINRVIYYYCWRDAKPSVLGDEGESGDSAEQALWAMGSEPAVVFPLSEVASIINTVFPMKTSLQRSHNYKHSHCKCVCINTYPHLIREEI